MTLIKNVKQFEELNEILASFMRNLYNSNIEIWILKSLIINSVSNFGNVKNNKTNVIYKGDYVNGYHRVDLKDSNGITKHYKVHRLVCNAFNDNPNNKPLVDHINGNKTDNHIRNLRFVTHAENKFNSKLSKNNNTGYEGARFYGNKYIIVNISYKNKCYYLGRFTNIEDAIKVRRSKARELHGEYINVCEMD
jgi:hypothetical protein